MLDHYQIWSFYLWKMKLHRQNWDLCKTSRKTFNLFYSRCSPLSTFWILTSFTYKRNMVVVRFIELFDVGSMQMVCVFVFVFYWFEFIWQKLTNFLLPFCVYRMLPCVLWWNRKRVPKHMTQRSSSNKYRKTLISKPIKHLNIGAVIWQSAHHTVKEQFNSRWWAKRAREENTHKRKTVSCWAFVIESRSHTSGAHWSITTRIVVWNAYKEKKTLTRRGENTITKTKISNL